MANGSATTGSASCTPNSAANRSARSGVGVGVIRSTIELGKVVFSRIHCASSGLTCSAWAVKARRATSPFLMMLSQETIVGEGWPRSRRRFSASATNSNAALSGGW